MIETFGFIGFIWVLASFCVFFYRLEETEDMAKALGIAVIWPIDLVIRAAGEAIDYLVRK